MRLDGSVYFDIERSGVFLRTTAPPFKNETMLAKKTSVRSGSSSPIPLEGLGACLDSGEIVTFIVRDFARARAFYVEKLRLPIIEERTGRYVMMSAGRTRLCIDKEDGTRRARGGGVSLVLFTKTLDTAEQTLRARGVTYWRKHDRERGDYLLIVDPEGYSLSLSEPD